MYKESGPDGLGAMGAEPLLELAAWGLDRGGEQQGAAGAAAGHGADKVRCRTSVRLTDALRAIHGYGYGYGYAYTRYRMWGN